MDPAGKPVVSIQMLCWGEDTDRELFLNTPGVSAIRHPPIGGGGGGLVPRGWG